jgi:hypothetical protein
MASNQIDECMFRIDDHFAEYTVATSGCQRLRQQLEGIITRTLKTYLETRLAQVTKESLTQAVAGLEAQIKLLQLLKGSIFRHFPLR